METKPKVPASPSRRCGLEWIEAGSLTENPLNWRRHSQEQLQSIRELLDDPQVGWPRLPVQRADGPADRWPRRKQWSIQDARAGPGRDWSEEAEAKILATLDPVGADGDGDAEAYRKLIESVEADGLWVRDLLHNTAPA